MIRQSQEQSSSPSKPGDDHDSATQTQRMIRLAHGPTIIVATRQRETLSWAPPVAICVENTVGHKKDIPVAALQELMTTEKLPGNSNRDQNVLAEKLKNFDTRDRKSDNQVERLVDTIGAEQDDDQLNDWSSSSTTGEWQMSTQASEKLSPVHETGAIGCTETQRIPTFDLDKNTLLSDP